MHQFVEAKEGCQITPDPGTLARVSYQSFFRRYVALSGMTGTAGEVAGELWSVYGLPVVRIPSRLPSRRSDLGTTILKTQEEKWQSVVAAVASAHNQGCPVLVGTRNVATSEQVSDLLTEAGLHHFVLNAKQDDQEAEIISHAGEQGRITVATNMAGRGTDIRLGPAVTELGGLHVVLTEYHDAARIDRQLIGRCARQGDPGSYQVIASLEDPIIVDAGSQLAMVLARGLRVCPATIARAVGPLVMRLAQRRVEREFTKMRHRLLQADDVLNSRLAFAGRAE
jgi:preprotein translocase subunit SecA